MIRSIAMGAVCVVFLTLIALCFDRPAPKPASPGETRTTMLARAEAGNAQRSTNDAPLSFASVSASPTFASLEGRPVDLGGKTVGQYVQAHAAGARRGDTDEAYKVYAAESVCASRARLSDVATGTPADLEAASKAELARIEAVCADVSPAQIQERLGFLLVAAKARNHQAETAYFTEGPRGQDFNPAIAATDPATLEWVQNSITYLKDAGAQGDPYALLQLAQLYETGVVISPDLRQALTYASALTFLQHPNKDVSQNGWVMQLSQQLPAPDAADATQAGITLARRCCAIKS